MKVLMVSHNPSRASFRQRMGIYLNTLRANGIDCKVEKLPDNYLIRWRLFKKAAEFDGVLLHKKCLNFLDSACLRRYSKKIIYDFDDAVMYSPERPESDNTSHFRLFSRTAKMADCIIAGNSYLAEHAKRFNSNVKIVPTGLDISEYEIPVETGKDNKVRLVWIGSKSTLKYLMGIKPALEQVGQCFENVVLRIICDEFFDLRNMEVEKCVWSLKEQFRDLVTSDISLAPLPNNRFTRGKCGFKILQYAAAGLPVVASPVEVNAEYVEEGITGYLAEESDQWVESITKLVEDPELREKMGQEGQSYARGFDVGVISKQMTALITECLKGSVF